VVEQVTANFHTAPVSPKLKALLAIAGKVRQDGKLVTKADVAAARKVGATDIEIHDTVLIAAAFSMFNRYVEGLGTWQPRDPEMYARMGQHLASEGYLAPSIKQPLADPVSAS
jgi:hypothetical protein